jgi:hypothetical protein
MPTIIVEQYQKRWTVIQDAESPDDALSKSKVIPAGAWLTEPTSAPVIDKNPQSVQSLNFYLRLDQPHLQVSYDTKYSATGTADYYSMHSRALPTFRRAYLPYDLVMAYGRDQAFMLVAKTDPIHIIEHNECRYFTHDGKFWLNALDDILLPPDELAEHLPNH